MSLLLDNDFLNSEESAKLFQNLRSSISWRQDEIRIFGKWIKQPRETAVFGDSGLSYTYSGLKQSCSLWTPELLKIKSKIESVCNHDFNFVLINHYRDGADSMGWHSDDEKELGKNPVIASISLGAERKLKFRPKNFLNESPFEIEMKNGSLLLMEGSTQHHWQHSIAKSKKVLKPRINLTFRKIYN
jgi:alkylated DNA repair dioxygenase AlkB